jgi:C-terminal processing protease CtpA/Prc
VGRINVGVLRIGIFQPQGYPEVCRAAVRALAIPADKSCDDQCQDQILTWAYRRLTGALEQRVRALKAAGATVILIDVTNNGGGSEWAEAVARIFSAKQLVSERRGFVRGEHWAKQWRSLADSLREYDDSEKQWSGAEAAGLRPLPRRWLE